MANRNKKQCEEHSFNIKKPLDDKEKEVMLKKINSTLRHVFSIMAKINYECPGEDEDQRIKRVFMFTSDICKYTVEYLEESGAVVVLDKNLASGILTDLVIPMPAMIEGFATDIIKDM